MFEAPEWQRLFTHMSEAEKDAESRLWADFFAAISFKPGILKDVRILFEEFENTDTATDTYTVPRSRSQYLSSQGLEVLQRARRLYNALHDSHILYQHRPPYPSSLSAIPSSPESPDRIRLRELYLYVMMYNCRLQATISPSELERASSEVEAQTLASQALSIREMAGKLDQAMAWHLEQWNGLAHSQDDYEEEYSEEEDEEDGEYY